MPTYDTSRLSGFFERSNLRTSNLEAVLLKLENSKQDGAEKLCIMADFDFTITKRWSDVDKKVTCPSTYDVIKDSDLIDSRCAEIMKVTIGRHGSVVLRFAVPSVDFHYFHSDIILIFAIFVSVGVVCEILAHRNGSAYECGRKNSSYFRMDVVGNEDHEGSR